MTLREKGIVIALDKFCKAMPGRGIPAGAKVRSYHPDLIVPVSFQKIPQLAARFAVEWTDVENCQTLSDGRLPDLGSADAFP
jgi:hypothetical protein